MYALNHFVVSKKSGIFPKTNGNKLLKILQSDFNDNTLHVVSSEIEVSQ